MTDLDQAVTDYLAVRQALGYKLTENAKQPPSFMVCRPPGHRGSRPSWPWPGPPSPPGVVLDAWPWCAGLPVTSKRSTLTPKSALGVLPHPCRRTARYV